MIYVYLVLIVIASALIALFILIQNPKGGGLAGTIGGFNTQFMGVKQTTDVLEKGTWLMAIVIALLCLFSSFFIPKNGNVNSNNTKEPPIKAAPVGNNPGLPSGNIPK
jgi:preprotein translocase subunit SecG